MKYQNHTAKYYASKAIKFADDTVKYPNIPQSTYDKGFTAKKPHPIPTWK